MVLKMTMLSRIEHSLTTLLAVGDSDSDLIFRRTLLGYDAEGMHANL